MIKQYNKLICILIISMFLSGCWDYRDVNKRSITLSLGVDNVNSDIEYTGEIAKLAPGSGGKGAQISDVYKFSSIGSNFEKSRADLDNKNSAPDFTGAVRVIAFSKNYAEKGIESYINRAYSIARIRNSVLLVISKERTSDLFDGKVKNDISIGYAIEDTVRQLSDGGATLHTTMQQTKSNISCRDIGYLLPYVTKDNNIIEYLGFAAMKDSKLVGIIDRKDSNGFLFLLADKPLFQKAIPKPNDEKNFCSIVATMKKRNIKTSYKDKKVNIYITLKLDAQLQYEYYTQPISEEDIKKLEEKISESVKKDVIYATNLSQNQFESDVFNFAAYFKSDNPQQYRKINWQEEYPKAIFHVNVQTIIRNKNLLDPNSKKPR